MKKFLSIILAMTILLSSTVNVFALQRYEEDNKDFEILFSEKNENDYVELTEENGILTYFYHSDKSNETLVISQSDEAGTRAYYNNGENLYEFNNVQNIDLKNHSKIEDFKFLAKEVADEVNYYNSNTISSEIKADKINELDGLIQPLNLSDAEDYFFHKVGYPFQDKNVASGTFDNKFAQVLETKNVSVKQVSRIEAVAGSALGAFLSVSSIPKSIAVAIGIATFVKNGIEYIKESCVILKYVGEVRGRKNVYVQNQLTHEVSSGSHYTMWENTCNDAIKERLDWNWADTDYNNNYALMRTAVGKY